MPFACVVGADGTGGGGLVLVIGFLGVDCWVLGARSEITGEEGRGYGMLWYVGSNSPDPKVELTAFRDRRDGDGCSVLGTRCYPFPTNYASSQ